jgi:protein ImuB
VLEGKPPLQKVFALNEKARCAGIEAGMTKLQAEICPGLVLRCRSAQQESAAHAALLDCAQAFSPRVEDSAGDTVVLDISGTDSLFGSPEKLAHDLAWHASEQGLEANIAVASNPDAALLAARGYSGVTVIPLGKEEERLGGLPLTVLFSGYSDNSTESEAAQFLETLSRWGVHDLRALAELPEVAISERLGQEGLHLQKLARGAVSRTIAPVDPPLVFEEAVELEYPLVLLEPLAFLLGRMLGQLCARLNDHALATQELRLKLELETGNHLEEELLASAQDCDPESGAVYRATDPGKATRTSSFTRTLRFPVPMLDSKIFLKLLQLDLKAHPPGAPITKICLTAEPVQARAAQGGLFLPPSPEPEKLALTLARISGIVGEDKVGALELLDTHRPEGFRMQHFAATDATPEQKKSIKTNGVIDRNAAVTALRMFRPPLRATVTLRDGRPARIACLKKKRIEGNVIWQAGPWRFSGDWWQHDAWARDEWDIALQTETGIALYRLVHDLLSGLWLIEGTYD